jgi:hypothetical protein
MPTPRQDILVAPQSENALTKAEEEAVEAAQPVEAEVAAGGHSDDESSSSD